LGFASVSEKPAGGETTSPVNPGAIWASRHLQAGVEAIVSIDAHSGRELGVRAQARKLPRQQRRRQSMLISSWCGCSRDLIQKI
jgi:hypothetical protein